MIELSSPHIRIPPISPTVIYERILPFLSASVNLYLAIPALTLKFILTLSEYIGFYFLILLYQRNLI